jgi:putative peptidoglycan lipid II flippase
MRGPAFIIAFSILVSRVLGVFREMLLARVAGINADKNALDLAFMIPDILNSLVATGFLSIIFIPIFTGYMVKNEEERAWKFFANIINTLGVLMLLLIVPAWFYMREAILLFTTARPSPEVLALSVHYGRIILPGQLAFFAGSFLVAVQYTRKQFLIPSLTGVIYNLAIIVGGWLGRRHGLDGFAWGVPIGAFVGFFGLQLWGVLRGGLHWKPVFEVKDPDVRHYLKLMLPLMMGVGAMFALEFVIKSFGSEFGPHGISALNYAYRLMYTLVAVFGFSVGVASYPDMARMVKEGRLTDLNERVAGTVDRMFAILIPAIASFWLLAFAATRILFERGAFSREATELVSELLRWYLPASLGLCTQAVLVRSFYAQERMWTPTLVNTGIFLVSLLIYGPVAHALGIKSVPLVGGVTSIIQVLALGFVWQHLNGRAGLYKHAHNILRSLLALVLVGCALAWLGPLWDPMLRHLRLLELVGIAAVSGAVIFGLTLGLEILLGNHSAKALVFERLQRVKKVVPV